MKEKTRKTAAIWLVGLGMLGSGILIYGLFEDLGFYYVGYGLGPASGGILHIFLQLLSLALLGLGVRTLKKIISPVMRLFFKRFLIAIAATIITTRLCVILYFSGLYNMMPLCFFLLYYLPLAFCFMSGAGLVNRYYRLDELTASKLRLFQTGTLCYFIPFLGQLIIFLGLKGIIQSDLVTEERSGEDCGVVSGGWWSRPVKAMVCFYIYLLVLGGGTVAIALFTNLYY